MNGLSVMFRVWFRFGHFSELAKNRLMTSGSRRLFSSASVHAGAGSPRIDEGTTGPVVAEQQRAEKRAAALWIGPADYDEFLSVVGRRREDEAWRLGHRSWDIRTTIAGRQKVGA
jgi:hypothetical protein